MKKYFKTMLFVSALVCVCLCNTSIAQTVNRRAAPVRSNKTAAHLNVQFENCVFNELVELSLFKKTLINSSGSASMSEPIKLTTTKNKNGMYQFSIAGFAEPCYISLGYGTDSSSNIVKSRFNLLNLYLLEPGDDVTIKVVKDSSYKSIINTKGIKINDGYFSYIYNSADYSLHFSGNGSVKYECRYIADRIASACDKITASVLDRQGNTLRDVYMDRQKNQSINILLKYKSRISSFAFALLSTDFLGKYNADWFRLFGFKWFDWRNGRDTIGKDKTFFINAKKAFDERVKETTVEISPSSKKISAWYPYWIIQKEVASSRIRNADASAHDNGVYGSIKKSYRGETRDKILTDYLMDWYVYLNDGQAILQDATSIVSTKYYRDQLQQLEKLQTKGKTAFKFSLPDTKGNIVKLQDLSGKIVFIDFWYTGCENCVAYFKYVLKDMEEKFKDHPEVKFMTINIDLDKQRWLKSVNSGMYTSSNAINLNTGGVGADHAVIKHYNVTGYPRPLLIDKNGKIFSASATDLRNKEKLKQLIEEALKQD